MHTPVLLEQVLTHLDIKPGMKIVDATFGEGGHTQALLKLGASVLAIDADEEQIKRYKIKNNDVVSNKNLQLVLGNFGDIAEIARQNKFDKVDAVLFDLGLSMNQVYYGEGFSYQFPLQPLNLVIDSQAKQKGAARAAEVVTEYDERRLTNILMKYGELKRAPDIARAILRYRSTHEIKTVGDLLTGLKGTLYSNEQAALFQALRIEVNQEYEQITKGLEGAIEILGDGGKLAVITFHSGEDRVVKLWARKKGLKELVRVRGNQVSDKSFERSSILRIYVQS